MPSAARLERAIITDEDTGQTVSVNSDGQLHVVLEGKPDTGNSTETPLVSGAAFTGTGTDCSA